MMKITATVLVLVTLIGGSLGQSCVGRAPNARLLGPELLKNPGFEDPATTTPWYPSDVEGFALIPGNTPANMDGSMDRMHSNYAAQIITSDVRSCSLRPQAGIFQQVQLKQSSPHNIYMSGWGRGVNISGQQDADFSLYADITYADNSTRYGQFVPFPIDGNWNQVALEYNVSQPIDSLFLNLLFRNHLGTAYFDNISVREEATNSYPLNKNILNNPNFGNSEDCMLHGWTQLSPSSSCNVTTCNADSMNGNGSLSSVPLDGRTSCKNYVYQTVCFNPPISNSLTFSAYVSVKSSVSNYIAMELILDQDTLAGTNIPIDVDDEFQMYTVNLTPEHPISSVDVAFLWDGDDGVVWDSPSLILS
jgi:hypothetical protein